MYAGGRLPIRRKPKASTGCERAPADARSRGAAVVEFALIMPILILLVFGIFEFGRAYNAKVTLTHAAREAVRDYTINGDEADAIATGVNAAPALSGVTVTIVDSCDGTPGDDAEAEASWVLDYTIPLFNSGSITLDESAVMRCGG